MNKKQLTLIKKDIRSITSNKQVFMVMLIVPLALTVVLPSIFVFVTILVPEAASDFQALVEMLPISTQEQSQEQLILSLILNQIMPVFFLLIPIMASSIMAASSFVGEKEKRTLETLLYSPLSLKQLFQAKILAAFSVGMIVSFISFIAMIIVVGIEMLMLTDAVILPDINWLVIMLVLAPSISLVSIGITVLGSAKSQTIEESQQRAVFLVLPIIGLVIGQFTGIILVNSRLLLVIGIILALLAGFIMKNIGGKFSYEKLLE